MLHISSGTVQNAIEYIHYHHMSQSNQRMNWFYCAKVTQNRHCNNFFIQLVHAHLLIFFGFVVKCITTVKSSIFCNLWSCFVWAFLSNGPQLVVVTHRIISAIYLIFKTSHLCYKMLNFTFVDGPLAKWLTLKQFPLFDIPYWTLTIKFLKCSLFHFFISLLWHLKNNKRWKQNY